MAARKAAKKTAAKKTAAKKTGRKKTGGSRVPMRKDATPQHLAGDAEHVAVQFDVLDDTFAKRHAAAWDQVVVHLGKATGRFALAHAKDAAIAASIKKVRLALDEQDFSKAIDLSHFALKTIASALPGRVTVPPPPGKVLRSTLTARRSR